MSNTLLKLLYHNFFWPHDSPRVIATAKKEKKTIATAISVSL